MGAGDEINMSKIAVIGVPLHGHVSPVVPLVHELCGAGFEVHYYNTERFATVAREAHALFVAYHSMLETDPDPHPRLVFLHREIPHVISQLEGKLLWEKYDLVLYDSFCVWMKYLAMRHRLPALELLTAYPNAPIRDSSISGLVHLEYEDASLEYIRRFDLSAYTIDCPAGKTMPRSIGLYDLRLLDAALKSPALMCPDWITAVKIVEDPAPMNLVFMPEEFLDSTPEKPDVHYHFLPSLYRLWSAKKEGGEKLIYASFGTRGHITERLITTWLKKPGPENLSLHVVAGDRAELLQHYAGENLKIENFADQHAVLARAGAFITHGGMSSVMEAILTETPMLVIPLTFEQELTARNIHKFRLGMHFSLEKLETLGPQQLVIQLMDNAVIRENLKIWRARILSSGGAARAVDIIEQFIGHTAGT
jgi:MGT family glycosyltransferase